MPPLKASSPDRPAPRREPPRKEAPRKDAKRGKGTRGWARRLGRVAALVGIWGFMIGLFTLAYFAHDLPDIREAVQLERRPTLELVAADGSPLQRLGDMRGATVDATQLPKHLVEAVLAVEDRRFWDHWGVDPLGIARAAYVNWKAGRIVQGGSTITQQLAKNLFLTPEQNAKRKIQEALLALWLERKYSKNQILTAYLNRVYLGAGTYGVDAAARTYFDKPATQLSLRESAILAGLLKAPSRYSPTSNPNLADKRMEVVLVTMVDAGFITEAARQQVLRTPVSPRRKPGPEVDGRYFAAYVADQVNAFIGPDHGDLIVYTTFDPKAQMAATRRVEALMSTPATAEARAGQAAAIVMTPDGAVRAMVGGKDYDESQFNRSTQALRQPGSAFKPFVFLAALEAGASPGDPVMDAPYKKGKWEPGNYDGKFRGQISMAEALAESVNTATIRLLERAGVDRASGIARRLGITSPMRRDLSLALGTSEVTLLELTGAYAAIANGGQAIWPYAILEIRDSNGALLYQRKGSGAGYAVSGPDLQALTRMMEGVLATGTGTSARLDRPAAAKTGTTQDYKDAWFMGFTADYVTGVWLGNDDGAPMRRVTGGSLPARLWRDIMADLHQGLPVRPLPGSDGTVERAPEQAVIAEHAATPEGAGAPADSTGNPIADLLNRLTGAGR
ncbi:MAG TPA: PBP1A family penicillin-binding protein [Azospirillaceae bacterium]|nr:PBP1A family penicillin-binding protein [Azospirillaceae bacterium]